jgi:hypothetical protein
MRYLKLIGVMLILLIAVSCNWKSRSWYQEPVIAVMADPEDWEALQGVLRDVFERVIRTPQVEKMYTLRYVEEEEFDRYTAYRHVLIVGSLQSSGNVGKLISKVVSDPQIRDGVRSGDYYIFPVRDEWAQNQILAVLVADDIPSLRDRIESNSHFIYNIFHSDFKEHLIKDMYRRREQKDINKKLMSNYNWSIRVQPDYFIVEEYPDEGFLWLRRLYPERWVFFRWIENADTSFLNSHWVIGERNRIGSTYYGGDRVGSEYLFSHRGEFLGRPAQITSGLWKNYEKMKGGPFKNYTFYDGISNRLYMIDIAVHAPGQEKVPFLRRMDVMVNTFRTVFDMERD